MWQRPGHPTRIAAAGTDHRSTIFGALDITTGHLTTIITPRASGHEFLRFLHQLLARWPSAHLTLIMDNVSYHKTAAVRHWLATYADRITVLWLPIYTPHLNRIERVWRFLKHMIAGHRFWNAPPDLIHLVNHLLHRIHYDIAAVAQPRISLEGNLCKST